MRAMESTRFRGPRTPPGVAQGALLAGLVVAAWAPAWIGGVFIWDSEFFVRDHPAVHAGWPGLRALWTTFGADPSGFVVMRHHAGPYTTFWLDSALWGGWAPGYHATNVALHALNACLAWRLLARLRVPGAWWAAVVFALHPGQVEPVAWIIGRKDVLAGTFVLLAVAVWLRWLAVPTGPRLCLLILLYILGAWSKSSALVLPVLLLILRWWTADRLSLRDLRWWVPLAIAGSLLLLLELSVFSARAGLPEYSFLERTLIAVRALWVQWGIVLWPHPLPILYPHWPVSPTDPAGWAGLVLIAAVCVLLWRFRHRLGRGPLAAWLWFFVACPLWVLSCTSTCSSPSWPTVTAIWRSLPRPPWAAPPSSVSPPPPPPPPRTHPCPPRRAPVPACALLHPVLPLYPIPGLLDPCAHAPPRHHHGI